MRKVFCDGCDRELGGGIQHNEVSVTVLLVGARYDTIPMPDPFDLCNCCKSRLESQANPRKWVRPEPPAPRGAVRKEEKSNG